MITPQLLDHIKAQLSAGVLESDLRKSLIANGWTEADVTEAIIALAKPAVPTPLIPSAPAVLLSAKQAPLSAPVQSPAPSGGRRRALLYVLIALCLLAGAGGAYASGNLAALARFIPFLSHAPYDKDKLLSGVARGLSQITTSVWDINVHIFTEAKDADAVPFEATSTKAKNNSLDSITAYIPANFDVVLDVNGGVEKTEGSANARAAISLNISAEDFSAAVAAELRKVDDNVYAIITKIPGLFGDFSALKNKWVIITPEDQKKYGSLLNLKSIVPQKQNDRQQQALRDLQTLLGIEETDRVLLSADPRQVTLDGESLYEYDLTLNPASLSTFYSDAMNAFKDQASSTYHFDQTTLDYLNSVEGQQYSDYLAKNLSITMWADSEGMPHKFEASLRIVPGADAAKLAGKQVRIVADLALTDINKHVVIDAPSPTISVDEAYKLAFGKNLSDTLAQSNDARRMADIRQLQLALELYYDANGSYPETTAFLAPHYISKVPLDPVDTATYRYTSYGQSYTLSADLERPNSTSFYLPKGTGVSTKSCSGESSGRYCYHVSQ